MVDVKYCLVLFPKASKLFVMRRKYKRGCKHAYFFSQNNGNTRGRRRTAVNQLKEKWIDENIELTFERRIFLKFRDTDAHKNHLTN